ncbi:hypothetical protein JHW43_002391 [Diplocarpon mali]|nr:hypothetical protein JHW43_002391 [Diplocarpon mali]
MLGDAPLSPRGSHLAMDSKTPLRREDSELSLRAEEVSRSTAASVKTPLRRAALPPRHGAAKGLAAHLAPWSYELVASLIAVATLAGLVITLARFDGRQYRQWKWMFTLNGIVAILSTVCHTAIMVPLGSAISQAAWLYYLPADPNRLKLRDLDHFETFNDASRGVFGSVRLLWQVRGRNFVALGAVLTVLALAFDTCTQQVVSLQGKSIAGGSSPLHVAGEVPRSTYEGDYDHGSTFSDYIPTLSTRAAIYNGILAREIEPLPVPCSTGNCTWPIVPSLAVCGECSPSTFRTACNATHCNHTMPTGTVFAVPSVLRTQNPLFQVTAYSAGGARYNSSAPDRAYVGLFDAIGVPWGEIFPDNASIAATECGLWICAQAYNISHRNGVQTHVTLANWSTMNPASAGPRGASSAAVVGNRTLAALPASMNPAPGQNFSISGLSILSASKGLQALDGTVAGGSGTKSYSTDFIQSIWNNTGGAGLDPWVKRLALSMTNNLRATAPAPALAANASFYAGTAYHTQYFFAIRWEWLTLPILVVLASLLFLLASIVRSARSGVEVVKGSPLALLFSDIDRSIKERLAMTGSHRCGGMRERAGKTRVVLHAEEGKWLFKEA